MTKSVNYKAAEGMVLCWIPLELRPINIMAQWNDLKESLVALPDEPQFPTRVFDGEEDEYVDVFPYQAKEIKDAWHEAHPEPECTDADKQAWEEEHNPEVPDPDDIDEE